MTDSVRILRTLFCGVLFLGVLTLGRGESDMTDWGLRYLQGALAETGYDLGAVSIDAVVDPDAPGIPFEDRRPEAYALETGTAGIRITGVDNAGVLYGFIDAAERIRRAGEIPDSIGVVESPTMGLRGPCILLMKLGAYNYAVSPEEFPFFYDRELWLRWLDRMAELRYNTLTLWNGHPFAYFVPFDRFKEAQEGMEPGLVERNREMLHWLVDEGKKRNIQFVFQFYNIHTSVYFQEAHNLPDEVSEPTELLTEYTSYAVERFVSEFPEIGLHITPGEALDLSWTDHWVNNVLYPAIRKGGIQAPVIVRAWGLDLPHAQKIATANPETWFERKFNVEMIADTRADPENRAWADLTGRHVVNIHMAANLEPFRWSPPDYVRQCVLNAVETGAGGLHLYPRKSWRWPDGSEPADPRLQWERDWMWYETWARYAWKVDRDPVAEQRWWQVRLEERFGDRVAAAEMLQSMEVAADVLPAIQRLVWLGNDNHTVVTAGIRLSQMEKAMGIPFMDLLDVGQRIPNYLQSIASGIEPVTPTPTEFLEQLLEQATVAADLMTTASAMATRRTTEMEAWSRDAEAVRLTTRFYLERMRAAELKARPGVAPDAFMEEMEQSLATFRELAALTRGYDSLSDVPMWKPVRLKKVPYHWSDVIPLYEKEIAMYGQMLSGNQEEASSEPVHDGLVSLLYGDPGLARPREAGLSTSVAFEWAAGGGRNWSKEWRGYLIPPGNGAVVLTVESDQPVRLILDGRTAIDFADGAGDYRIPLTDGSSDPLSIQLAYDHARGVTGRLLLQWALDGSDPEAIPSSALKHSDSEQAWVAQALFLSQL